MVLYRSSSMNLSDRGTLDTYGAPPTTTVAMSWVVHRWTRGLRTREP
jgi:hypothetical protein